jgi:hypothetical protein
MAVHGNADSRKMPAARSTADRGDIKLFERRASTAPTTPPSTAPAPMKP